MKIEVERKGGAPCTLSEFADRHGLKMKVVERPRSMGPAMRFYAHFDHVEVKEGCMLASYSGDGATPEDAMADYAMRIRSVRLVHRAMHPERREIGTPYEWLPEKP